MKKIVLAFLIVSSAVFLGLIAYAGLAPTGFADSNILLVLFRISGAATFIAVIYLVARLFRAGMRSSKHNEQK